MLPMIEVFSLYFVEGEIPEDAYDISGQTNPVVPHGDTFQLPADTTNRPAKHREFSHFCLTGLIPEESVEVTNILAGCDFPMETLS